MKVYTDIAKVKAEWDKFNVSVDRTLLNNFKAEELEVLLEKHPSIEKVEVFANQKRIPKFK